MLLFQARFEDAWNRAQPLHPHGLLWWWLVRNWQWAAFFLTALISSITLSTGHLFLNSIAVTVASTFFLNALVASWQDIRIFLLRLLHIIEDDNGH